MEYKFFPKYRAKSVSACTEMNRIQNQISKPIIVHALYYTMMMIDMNIHLNCFTLRSLLSKKALAPHGTSRRKQILV